MPDSDDQQANAHSLAPLTGSSEDGDEAEAPGSALGEVWRRRWVVAGAAALAFFLALAFGRIQAVKRTSLPVPTTSVAARQTLSVATASDVEATTALPEPAPPQITTGATPAPSLTAPPQAADVAAAKAASPPPAATVESLELPPTEVPPSEPSTQSSVLRAPRAAPAAPRKRYVPTKL